MGENKGFSASRCVWCGKIRDFQLRGAFGVAKKGILSFYVRFVWQNKGFSASRCGGGGAAPPRGSPAPQAGGLGLRGRWRLRAAGTGGVGGAFR